MQFLRDLSIVASHTIGLKIQSKIQWPNGTHKLIQIQKVPMYFKCAKFLCNSNAILVLQLAILHDLSTIQNTVVESNPQLIRIQKVPMYFICAKLPCNAYAISVLQLVILQDLRYNPKYSGRMEPATDTNSKSSNAF